MAKKRIPSADRPPPLPFFLKQWRLHRRLTQEQLAAAAGTTPSTISELERGNQRYTQQLLEALARSLNTHPGLILMGPPDAGSEVALIVEQMSPAERQQALDMLGVLSRRPAAAPEAEPLRRAKGGR